MLKCVWSMCWWDWSRLWWAWGCIIDIIWYIKWWKVKNIHSLLRGKNCLRLSNSNTNVMASSFAFIDVHASDHLIIQSPIRPFDHPSEWAFPKLIIFLLSFGTTISSHSHTPIQRQRAKQPESRRFSQNHSSVHNDRQIWLSKLNWNSIQALKYPNIFFKFA